MLSQLVKACLSEACEQVLVPTDDKVHLVACDPTGAKRHEIFFRGGGVNSGAACVHMSLKISNFIFMLSCKR
jgi:hypothetical protein